MILTSNKKHFRANIFYFENMYKKKRQPNKCFLHAIFSKSHIFGQFSNFCKKKWWKGIYFTKNNLKVTLLVLCYQENIKLMLYENAVFRYEAQKNPHFFKNNGGARSIFFFQNTLHCAALSLKINRLRLSKDMAGYYIP